MPHGRKARFEQTKMLRENFMKQSTLCTALALGLAFAASPALSASTGTVTLGNLQISLIDLDLNDGVTPWITMNYESQPYLNGAVGSFNPDYERDGYAHLGKRADSVVSDAVQTAFAGSSATMVGASNVAGFSLMSVSGSAGSSAIGYGEFGALAANYTLTGFTLSANTALSITVDARMEVGTTIGYNPSTALGEHAASHVLFLIDGVDENGNSMLDQAYQELYVDYGVDANGNITGAQQNWSGTLSVAYNNFSTNSAVAGFYSEIGVGGSSVTTPVPEPESYALLLGGLAVIGAIARRRRA